MWPSSAFPDPTIRVVELGVPAPHRLRLVFSDGRGGVWDCRELTHRTGAMIEPLKDPAFFARAFLQDGVPTWPNGYDWDPIALHEEMLRAGALSEEGVAA